MRKPIAVVAAALTLAGVGLATHTATSDSPANGESAVVNTEPLAGGDPPRSALLLTATLS